jgi:hypothetical protein
LTLLLVVDSACERCVCVCVCVGGGDREVCILLASREVGITDWACVSGTYVLVGAALFNYWSP